MQKFIGYSLIDSNNTEVKYWGNVPDTVSSKPELIVLPNGDQVHCMELNKKYGEFMLVERWVDNSPSFEYDIKIGETILFDGIKTVVTYNYEQPPIEVLRFDFKNKVTSIRYEKEVSGTVVDSTKYSTDRESQTKYVAVALDISQSADPLAWSINWKTADNTFITLNALAMNNVISNVRNHVQTCFDKESEYFTLIDTANTSVLETTDFSAGWPSNS